MRKKPGRPPREPTSPEAREAERIRRKLRLSIAAFAHEVLHLSETTYLRFRAGKQRPGAMALRIEAARKAEKKVKKSSCVRARDPIKRAAEKRGGR